MGGNIGFEDATGRPAPGVDPVQHDIDAVPRQVLRQFFGGVLVIEALLVENGDDADLLRLFK